MAANFPANLDISLDPTDLNKYGGNGSGECYPKAVVNLKTVEEVKDLVDWANRSSTALVPISSQRGETSTRPLVDGAVIADLSSMNSFKHIDSRDKIAIIEPGVTFAEVDELLKPHGLRAFRPLKPQAGKSVMASYLDREPLISPSDHWDVADPFGGTCVVLGSGDIQFTGTAANEGGSLEQQLAKGHRQMVAPGPVSIEVLRVLQGAQGSLGIMAWGAVYCERIPKLEKSWFASADNLSSVAALARDLSHRRNGSALFIVDRVQLALMVTKNHDEFSQLQEVLPPWVLFVSLAGFTHKPEQKLAWQTKALESCALQNGVELHDALAGVSAETFASSLRETDSQNYRDQPLGAHKELFFLQTFGGLDSVTEAAKAHVDASAFNSRPIGTYIQPMAQGTYCHVEYILPYSNQDDDLADQIDAFWLGLIQCCDKNGAFYSRPYGDWKQVAFAGKQSTEYMLSAAKKMLDPNGVMNPNRLPYKGFEK